MVSDARPPAPDGAWWLQPEPSVPVAADVSTPAAAVRVRARPAAEPRLLAPTKPQHAQVTLEDHGASPGHLRCEVCARANPPDAFYCYFDGKPLFKDLQPTTQPVGSLPFPAPFCFAGGQTCANFNQLALACNNLWEEARELLKDEIWPAYFVALGRLDLAAAARLAAREPDLDRGLHNLLERFPADPRFLRPPQLALGAGGIDLGSLTPGTDYTFDLVIANQGMRLLHGVAVSHFDWLVFGEPARPLPVEQGPVAVRAGAPPSRCAPAAEKFFQARHGCAIPVRVLGSKLRAGLKPLHGEIMVDTNGGAAVAAVRATVPIRPFPRGDGPANVLADVRSPRELAVQARRFPQEAGRLLEQGAVKAWYASNGWTYPIQDAAAGGASAVQQFFEALGLTSPPRLQIDTASLALQGKAGETLTAQVTLASADRKPVYAQAWSDQEWVTAGPPQYLGSRVRIPVQIVVPFQPGKAALAHLTIQGNARQRFVVPITVTLRTR